MEIQFYSSRVVGNPLGITRKISICIKISYFHIKIFRKIDQYTINTDLSFLSSVFNLIPLLILYLLLILVRFKVFFVLSSFNEFDILIERESCILNSHQFRLFYSKTLLNF